MPPRPPPAIPPEPLLASADPAALTHAWTGWALAFLAAAAAIAALVALARLRGRARRTPAAAPPASDRELRLAEIGAMTAGLAHEIKNPLSTIGMNAQLLAEQAGELPLDDDAKGRLVRRLGTLNREVDRLRDILADFLEYAGEVHLEPREADLVELADELTDFFLPQVTQRRITLRLEPAPRPLVARVDPQRVKQAVLNLMLNAAQALGDPPEPEPAGRDAPAPRPRELIVRTAPRPDDPAGPAAAIHVIDTGPGMAPDVRDRVFQPYFTTKGGGTGLGLPMARRIVEAHGGRLELFSEPGRGTDVGMIFPLAGPEPPDPADEHRAAGRGPPADRPPPSRASTIAHGPAPRGPGEDTPG